MPEILIVDGDRSEVDGLMTSLARNGHNPRNVTAGREALAAHQEADMVLLGLELPDLDGLEICRRIRASSDVPIIAYTIGDSELDKVLSLKAGADDCLVKPFGHRELCARIEAILRRAHKGPPADRTPSVLSSESLTIDPRSRQVWLRNQIIRTTRKEFDLLLMLASHPGKVFSRKELMSRVWQDEWASSRTVDTHVSMLRGKLGSADPIVTVRGIGYRFDDADMRSTA
jgi:DNA-binding response OmpR family regulator